MSEETIEAAINHEIALEDSHPRGEKPKFFGEVVEQDALFIYGLVVLNPVYI